MKRFLKYLPILALVMGAGLAVAMQSADRSSNTYTVISQDEDFFHVTATPDPDCVQAGSTVCEITSNLTPDSMNRIPRDQAQESGWKN